MSMANPMYQVSLDQFLGKFFTSIENAEKDIFPKKIFENTTTNFNVYMLIIHNKKII
jgi:hypothetical protein